jgi:hypothetical protein
VAYESRLPQAHVWPNNTTTPRAMFMLVLLPGGTMIGRILADSLKC